MLSTPPGPVDQASDAPRHVGDMLELAPGRWAVASAIVAMERLLRPALHDVTPAAGEREPATTEWTVVSLILTKPADSGTPDADEGRLETVTWESPYPVEVLVETIAQLKQLRLTQLRETRDPHAE
jgi:hypothetical protein